MWAHRLSGPARLEALDIAAPAAENLQEGQVLLKFRAAAICGSDIPQYLGRHDPTFPFTGEPGFPLHEVVGDVVASKAPNLRKGERVVGIAEHHDGLQEYFVNSARCVYPLDGSDLTDAEATVIQPMGTVFNAIARLPDPKGKRIAVIGLGPLGVLFCHALKIKGAKTIIGVDPIDRGDVLRAFGIDEQVKSPSRVWAESLDEAQRPEIIVEAVGHQQHTLVDAVRAIARLGHIFAFGVPDDDFYAIPFRELFRKNASLHAGATSDWQRSLSESSRYIHEHRDFLKAYITHVLPADRASEAFRLYAQPAVGRLKVVLTPP
ncbi:MAG: zinc-dependent alcohol dehydrogenase [Vulcanimicrobiaceae bacterium]